MPAVKTNNHAGRLHAIFCDARDSGPNMITRHALARAMRVNVDDPRTFSVAYSRLWDLIGCAKEQIKAIQGIDHELYLDSFPVIEQMISIERLEHSWQPCQAKLAEKGTLQGLAFCSELLDRTHASMEVAQAELDAIIKKIDHLSDAVLKSKSLNERLRHLIVAQLQALRIDVVTFRLGGPEIMQNTINATVGAVIRERDEYEAAKTDNSSDAELLIEFESILQDADRVVTAAGSSVSLAKRIKGIFLDGVKLFSVPEAG